MTEAELDRRLFNGEAVEAALELFAENQRLLSSEPSEGERETRRRVASAAFNIGSLIVDKRDAEIARLKAEVVNQRHEIGMLLSDLAAHKRALAAGPAALRIDARDGIPWGPYKQLPVEEAVATVEAAQAAAMKEGPVSCVSCALSDKCPGFDDCPYLAAQAAAMKEK